MIYDAFQSNTDTPSAPARSCEAIVPDDVMDLPFLTKAIYVGEGGDIVLRSADSLADTLFRNVPSGAILDIRVRAIRHTGTTAAAIVGLA